MRFLSVLAASLALMLGACSTLTSDIQSFSTNYQAEVMAINADILASVPAVATACSGLQTAGALLVPFVSNNQTASANLAAVNAGLNSYCQSVPTNINQTLATVAKATSAAQTAYQQVKSGTVQ